MKEVQEREDTRTQELNETGKSDRYAHLSEQAPTGGRAVVDKYGPEHMAKIGRRGSQAVIRKYGLRFYSEIAARNKGVKKRRTAE